MRSSDLSPQRIGDPLRDAGHDVLALAEDASYEGLADPAVLELAATQERVLITRNSRDHAPLAREWAEAQRTHAGMILIWTLDHSQYRRDTRGCSETPEPSAGAGGMARYALLFSAGGFHRRC
jgi:hypothetical protein